MATYRLVWSGDGALDLSQVLDTRGRPIVLSSQQRAVSIVEEALKSPYVQRYLSTPYLKAELLDGPKPIMSPPATPPAPVSPLPPPVVKPVEIVETPPAVVQNDIVMKETLAETPSSAEPPSPSTSPSLSVTEGTESKGGFKGRKSGRK